MVTYDQETNTASFKDKIEKNQVISEDVTNSYTLESSDFSNDYSTIVLTRALDTKDP
jgi:hypothetical protein